MSSVGLTSRARVPREPFEPLHGGCAAGLLGSGWCASAVEALTRTQFDECQDGVDDGGVDLNQSPEFCDRGYQGIGLQHTTPFQILQHGGFMCADGGGAGDALIGAERKFHAQAFSDGLCFQHHGAGHGAGSDIGADRLQGGAGQCTTFSRVSKNLEKRSSDPNILA